MQRPGRSNNLGEMIINRDGKGKLTATTVFQTFSLFVTAEPYCAVRYPSEMVVLQNELKKDSKAKIFPVNSYPLMRRSQYQKMGNPLALTLDLKNVPMDMYEARNAVEIAQTRGADNQFGASVNPRFIRILCIRNRNLIPTALTVERRFLNLAAICAIVIYARSYENKFCIMHRNLLFDS